MKNESKSVFPKSFKRSVISDALYSSIRKRSIKKNKSTLVAAQAKKMQLNNLIEYKSVAVIRKRSVWANNSASNIHQFLPFFYIELILFFSILGIVLPFNYNCRNALMTTTTTNSNMSKLFTIMVDLLELVADYQIEKLQAIIDAHKNVLSADAHELTALDLAVLMDEKLLCKLLLQNNIKSGFESCDEGIANADMEKILNNMIAYQFETSEMCTQEKRKKIVEKIEDGWNRMEKPSVPFSVTADVISSNAVSITILDNQSTTKFKVQWSSRQDFTIINGEEVITKYNIFQSTLGVNHAINNLIQGRRYYFRAASGNLKGFGNYKMARPTSLVPSSWKDIESDKNKQLRLSSHSLIDELSNKFLMSRSNSDHNHSKSNPVRRKKTTTAIKHLFSVASKFQKPLRRGGFYLASLMYDADDGSKVLVTSDDFLPTFEIDETYPSTFSSDLYWLMKIALMWDEIKCLRAAMIENASAEHNLFRMKLLDAIIEMQSTNGVGLKDLGQFFYKPLRDRRNGGDTIVLSVIRSVKVGWIIIMQSWQAPERSEVCQLCYYVHHF